MNVRPPLSGYNHNIRYREQVFHVQTEDSGLENPHVFTHLFLNGMVVSSLRTDYQDLVQDPDNADRVRKLMQEQHKQLMKNLRRGELNEQIAAMTGGPAPLATLPAVVEGTATAPRPLPPAAPASPARAIPSVAPPDVPGPQPIQEPVLGAQWDDQLFISLPVFEFEEGEDKALDLDIEAISNMDLDAVPQESSVKLSAWVQAVLEEMARHAPVGSGEELELGEMGEEEEFSPGLTPVNHSFRLPPSTARIATPPSDDTEPMPIFPEHGDPTAPNLPASSSIPGFEEENVLVPEQDAGIFDAPEGEHTDVIDVSALHGFDLPDPANKTKK